ncbi:MAG: DotA/TraY family protein [Desulfovibrio sp.]|nr:DotA/TraY family protein [Desulfovibrio sp.]
MSNSPVLAEVSSDLSQSDLSVQLLGKVFGSGWDRLAETLAGGASDGAMGTLIYSLLAVLNAVCAIVVAWLCILTTLSAALGAAQDGSGIGGRRFSSAWIPLRLSFAMGAVTPVFNGLNAMQVLVLSCLGASVGIADSMWSTGLGYIADGAPVAAVGSPSTAAGALRVLPVLVEHGCLRAYLETVEGCEFEQESRAQTAGWNGADYEIRFELPAPKFCRNPADGSMRRTVPTDFGDFGTVTVATPSKEASEALASAIAGPVYTAVRRSLHEAMGSGAEPGHFTLGPAPALGMRGLCELYQSAVAQALSRAALQADSVRAASLASFRDYASAQGWMAAGSWYWTLAKAGTDSVAAQQDSTSASPPQARTLAGLMNPAFASVLARASELASEARALALREPAPPNPVTSETSAKALSAATDKGEQSAAQQIGRFFSGAWQAVAEFKLSEAAAGKAALRLVAGNDIVVSTARAARRLMNVCETALVAYLGMRAGTITASSFLDGIPFVGGAVKTADSLLAFTGTIALCIAGPLWLVSWFYAYALPMIPMIAWFTAIVGWLVLALEAVVACPVWLVGHCMPEGEGFAGASARAGYALFLSVLLRPLLLVLAMFLCLIVLSVSGSLVGALLVPFFDAQTGVFEVEGGFGATAAISSVVLVGAVVGIATWRLFSLVTQMPDRIIRWAGPLLAHLGDDGAGQSVQHASRSMESAAGALVQPHAGRAGLASAGRMAGAALAGLGSGDLSGKISAASSAGAARLETLAGATSEHAAGTRADGLAGGLSHAESGVAPERSMAAGLADAGPHGSLEDSLALGEAAQHAEDSTEDGAEYGAEAGWDWGAEDGNAGIEGIGVRTGQNSPPDGPAQG